MDTKAKLTELQAQHGPVVHFTTKDGRLFAFRRPTLDAFETYQDKLLGNRKGATIGTLRRELMGQCLVFPTIKDGEPSALQAVLESAPMVVTHVAEALIELAEGDIEITVKKD